MKNLFFDSEEGLDQFIEDSKKEWNTEETRSSLALKEEPAIVQSVAFPVIGKQIRA